MDPHHITRPFSFPRVKVTRSAFGPDPLTSTFAVDELIHGYILYSFLSLPGAKFFSLSLSLSDVCALHFQLTYSHAAVIIDTRPARVCRPVIYFIYNMRLFMRARFSFKIDRAFARAFFFLLPYVHYYILYFYSSWPSPRCVLYIFAREKCFFFLSVAWIRENFRR